MLTGKSGHENVVILGARAVDPTESVDAKLDIRIDAGVISRIEPAGSSLDLNEHQVV